MYKALEVKFIVSGQILIMINDDNKKKGKAWKCES